MKHAKPYNLYFRKDTGYWFYRLPGGRWKTTGCSKEHEAHAYAMQQASSPHGVDLAGHQPTLEAFAVDFFVWGCCAWIRRQHAAGRPFSRAVAAGRRAHLERHILPRFGELALGGIRLQDVEAWILELPLANGTRNSILDTFKIVLREAVRHGLLPRSPLEDVVRLAGTYRARDVLSMAELAQLFPRHKADLLRVWAEPKWATLFYVMLTTGIRVGEAAALCWRHVLWGPPAILLVEQAVKADGTVGLPKSGQARAAFLPRRTAWTLRWWAERSPFTALEDLVFFGHRPDEPLNRKTISKRFGPALEAAGIERGERYTHLGPADRLRAILPAPPDLGRAWE